jgi:hypothetical protein
MIFEIKRSKNGAILKVNSGDNYNYRSRCLRPANSFIAAYTEWTGADALVIKNRIFSHARITCQLRCSPQTGV